MKLSIEHIKKIKPISQPTVAEELALTELLLMAKFLSEIEQQQKLKDIDRKTLAALIGTSPSYLTQVFRGDKPLNFKTLAKIQTVLSIRFDVSVKILEEAITNKKGPLPIKTNKAKELAAESSELI
jgi:transcriptional regulator with XRE-family HTH domain